MYVSIIVQSFTVLSFLLLFSNAEKCETNNIHFDCPRPDEPYDFSSCCMHENTTELYCCLNPSRSNRLLVMMSVTVILFSIISSFLIVICCFWSRCPLFDLCWVNYSKRGVIPYIKEEEELNEPSDENKYSRQYAPINVKVSRIDEV